MNHNLTPATRTFRLTAPVAAGVDGAVVTLPEIDLQGYTGVRIIYVLGAIAAGGVITVGAKNSDTSATYGAGTIDKVGTDLVNSADTDDNKVMIQEFYRLPRRYLRPQYQRTVGNTTIDSVVVELFHAIHHPVTQASADVAASDVVNNPTPSAT